MQFRAYNLRKKRRQDIDDTENLHLQKCVESSRFTAQESEICSIATNLSGSKNRKLNFTAMPGIFSL